MSAYDSAVEKIATPVLITSEARQAALAFARQQLVAPKANQIYNATIAVYAVHNYLFLLGIHSDLTVSDSCNPILQATVNTADLYIPGKGKLECCLVDPDDVFCHIPLEAQTDRIGYVLVHIVNDQQTNLLGFTGRIVNHQISLDQLQDIAELPVFLASIRPTAYLRQWLEDLYQIDWQDPNTVLTDNQLALGGWSKSEQYFQRAKLISWERQPSISPIALLVSISPEEEEAINVRIQVHPVIGNYQPSVSIRFLFTQSNVLPANLELSMLSRAETVLREVVSRVSPLDNCIQLPSFQGNYGEEFIIRISYQNEHFYQKFSI